jgi:hypothetical protein
MESDRTAAVEALLVEAEQAHGRYEATELDGVYDQEWPQWYAAYAVDHGLGELLGHDVTTDELAALLARGFAEFDGTEPKPAASWSTHIARRIASEL